MIIMNKLQVLFTSEQLKSISDQITLAIKEHQKLVDDINVKPYLKLNEFADWTGFTKPTIRKFVKAGLPVAIVDNQKMYVKQTYINWLKTKEQ